MIINRYKKRRKKGKIKSFCSEMFFKNKELRDQGGFEMFIIEEEAIKKICPFSIATPSETFFENCQASKCMLWRWGVYQKNGHPNKNNGGYCGLAPLIIEKD